MNTRWGHYDGTAAAPDLDACPLSIGLSDRIALVDSQDHERLAGFRWKLKHLNGYDYVIRQDRRPTRAIWLLHREVCEVRDNRRVTFRSGDHFDCRRANLEVFGNAEPPPMYGRYRIPCVFFYCRLCGDYHPKGHPHYQRVRVRQTDRVGFLAGIVAAYESWRAQQRLRRAEAAARYERLFRTRTPDEVHQLAAWREEDALKRKPRRSSLYDIARRTENARWEEEADRGNPRAAEPSYEQYSNLRLDLSRGLAFFSTAERACLEAWMAGAPGCDEHQADALFERLHRFVETGAQMVAAGSERLATIGEA